MKNLSSNYDHFIDLLLSEFLMGHPIKTTKDLVALSQDAGLIPGKDFTDFKLLYDSAEIALNKLLFSSNQLPNEALQSLNELSQLLPKETERSISQSQFQQFSTPLIIANILAGMVGVTSSSIVLDPSAGCGNLLTAAYLHGCTHLYANELHPWRYQLINRLPVQVTNEDALQIKNLPFFHELKVDKILINPPFSRNVIKGNRVDILAGAEHLVSAFKVLSSNGKMGAVMNSTFSPSSKAWNHLKRYAPEANIIMNCPLDLGSFKAKGTSISTRILLIDTHHTGCSTITETINLDEAQTITV